MKKLLDWITKTNPVFALVLLLLVLLPLYLFLRKLARRRKELAQVLYERDQLREVIDHGEALKKVAKEEVEQQRLDEQIKTKRVELSVLDVRLGLIEDERKKFEAELAAVTSWDEIE